MLLNAMHTMLCLSVDMRIVCAHLALQLFGLTKGSKVAVIIDASDANLGFGRQGAFSESLVVSRCQLGNKHRNTPYLLTCSAIFDPEACMSPVGTLRCHVLTVMFQHLFDEQLRDKASVYLAAFGSDVWPLWATPMSINSKT